MSIASPAPEWLVGASFGPIGRDAGAGAPRPARDPDPPARPLDGLPEADRADARAGIRPASSIRLIIASDFSIRSRHGACREIDRFHPKPNEGVRSRRDVRDQGNAVELAAVALPPIEPAQLPPIRSRL